MKKDIPNIVWPETPVLSDTRLMAETRRITLTLCAKGKVVEWQDGVLGIDTYTHMPKTYLIRGVRVNFLPHWGFITVGTDNVNGVDIYWSLDKDVFIKLDEIINLVKMGNTISRRIASLAK